MNLSYMQSLDFSPWFNCYQQQALMLNERRLIVLVGDSAWSSMSNTKQHNKRVHPGQVQCLKVTIHCVTKTPTQDDTIEQM